MKDFRKIFGIIALFSLLIVGCAEDDNFNDFAETAETNDTKTDETPPSEGAGHTCNSSNRCAMRRHSARLMKDPSYRQSHELKLKRALTWNSLVRRSNCNAPIRVPVAVHFQGASASDAACLRQLAISQIQILNEDYQGKNSDIDKWTNDAINNYSGITNGESCIEFVLATKNHPNGYGLSDGEVAVTVNKISGDTDSKWSNYLNIFVVPNTGYLGYSPLGGNGDGDGVVIDAVAFGKGAGCGIITPSAPYDLGRTLTHELGHYLLLDHIWGEGGCAEDDGVADTPNQESDNSGCPDLETSSCGSKDLFMNYMDYVNDACMFMFSAGQVSRMENYLQNSLRNVLDNAPNVLDGTGGGGGNTATCSDGIQNGNETGIDCGGSCAPCQSTASTDAGISTIISPQGSSPETRISPKVSLKNYGTKTLTSVKIKYQFNSDAVKTYNWTGNLVAGATTNVSLTATTLEAGNHNFQAYTQATNDENTSNDKKFKAFVITCGDSGGHGGDDEDDNETTSYTIEVTPDDFGSEIKWTLEDAAGAVVASGGSYEDGDISVKSTSVELEAGCYIFTIRDEYGDGICCDNGDGWYQILDEAGDSVYESDGAYGEYESVDFCIDVSGRSASSRNVKRGKRAANLPKKR